MDGSIFPCTTATFTFLPLIDSASLVWPYIKTAATRNIAGISTMPIFLIPFGLIFFKDIPEAENNSEIPQARAELAITIKKLTPNVPVMAEIWITAEYRYWE